MSDDTVPEGEIHTITVNDRELWLIRAALQEDLATMSHDEGDLVEALKALLLRLPTVPDGQSSINKVFPPSGGLTL